ncbi:MAG: TlpA family protein disulfide reductase [Chlorobi bacterium]|nr:TlpA family protein disulfide reductase [Chlorobiota bacterium]
MKLFRLAGFWMLWLLSGVCVFPASPVTVHGDAPQYRGDTLQFFIYDDLLSYTPLTLARIPVLPDGSFQGKFQISETMEIFVDLGIYRAFFYAEPGHTYDIILPPRKEKQIKDVLNPYFKPEPVHLGIRGTDAGNLNILIDRFDRVYHPFFYSHARSVFTETRNKHLQEFIDSVRNTFSGAGNAFFNDYMEARLVTLEVMILSDRARVLDKYTGFARNIRYRNPGYMELFNQVFNRYFSYLKRGVFSDKLAAAIIRYNDPDSLANVIDASLGGHYPQFTELVMIKGIYDAIYDGSFPKDKLMNLMEKINEVTLFPEHHKMISNLIRKVRFLEPGSDAPDFTLPDVYGHLVSLSDFRGKYVYLNFSSRLSYSSLRQFPLLEQLFEEFADQLVIVTVAPEDDPEALKYLRESRKYSWIFLVCSPSCTTPGDYGIRVFPSYYLISPDGKVVLSPAPPPTENFESVFLKILKKSETE